MNSNLYKPLKKKIKSVFPVHIKAFLMYSLKREERCNTFALVAGKDAVNNKMNGGLCDSSVCDAEISFICISWSNIWGSFTPLRQTRMLILSWKLKWSYRSQRGRTWRHADTVFLHALLLKQRPPVVSSDHCRLQDFLLERAVCIYSACGII